MNAILILVLTPKKQITYQPCDYFLTTNLGLSSMEIKDIFKKFRSLAQSFTEVQQSIEVQGQLSSMRKEELEEIKRKLEELYAGYAEVHVDVLKKLYWDNLDGTASIEFEGNMTYKPNQVLKISEARATQIQFSYLYPINMLLVQIYEQEAQKRERVIYHKGIRNSILLLLISLLLGFLIDWLRSFFWDVPCVCSTALPCLDNFDVTLIPQDAIEIVYCGSQFFHNSVM